MAQAVIVKVVHCEGTVFGEVWIAYYASGRMHEFYGEAIPKNVAKFITTHTMVKDKPHHNGWYQKWQ